MALESKIINENMTTDLREFMANLAGVLLLNEKNAKALDPAISKYTAA